MARSHLVAQVAVLATLVFAVSQAFLLPTAPELAPSPSLRGRAAGALSGRRAESVPLGAGASRASTLAVLALGAAACALVGAARPRSSPARRGAVVCRARGGALNHDTLVADLTSLVKEKNCGPILIRLSWHDAGVFSDGTLKGGCPNAAMRFTDGGEGTFGANAGLPDVALGLLKPITEKYVPGVISNADLWALAANVAIKVMGGPDIPTRFGRVDAKSSKDSVESQVGRLPDGDKGIDHLRDIFGPKGFDDKAIVALSGAHTVGRCHLDRSGFDGPWTEEPLKFDNTYFTEMLRKSYALETTAKGCPQHRDAATGTIMLISDLALLSDPAFRVHVERYAKDEKAYFADFKDAWVKLQELGVSNNLRTTL